VAGTPHRVVALAVPDVVAFDLSIAARIFGHRDERDRYSFAVCAERPGSVPSTTGFAIGAPHGLDVLEAADTARGARVASVCVGAFALAAAGLLDGRAATTAYRTNHRRAGGPHRRRE
jgi:transcriptional regulator GlxA family with amidase domain